MPRRSCCCTGKTIAACTERQKNLTKKAAEFEVNVYLPLKTVAAFGIDSTVIDDVFEGSVCIPAAATMVTIGN